MAIPGLSELAADVSATPRRGGSESVLTAVFILQPAESPETPAALN